MRLLLMLFLLAGPACSWATLGAAPSAFAQQRQSQASAFGQSAGASWQVVHTVLQTQTVINEYVSPSGQVFAVSWAGPFQPDLQELLGASFAKLAQPQGARTHLEVKDEATQIESSGHMGAFRGRAWLPALVPAGFDMQEIQ